MGFKRIISFDHLSLGLLNSAATESYAGAGIVGNWYGIQPTVVGDVDGRKKLVNGGLYSAIQVRFNNLGLDISKKVIMGYRHRPETSFVYGFSISSGIGTGGGSSLIWLCSDIDQTEEAFVEIVFDFVANSISAHVNGVKTKTVNYTTAQMLEFFNVYGHICFYGNNADLRSWVSDFYFRDQVGSEVIEPIGNVRLVPLPLDQTTGAGWTPAAGQTLTETLNTTSVPATPVITNVGTAPVSDLVSKMKPSGLDDTSVLAVQFIGSARDSAAPAKTLQCKLTIDGVTSNGASVPLTTTIRPLLLSIHDLAPDGSQLTLGKLKASTYTATFT